MSNQLTIEKSFVSESRLPATKLENLPFGRVFTDHMLEATYEGGRWTKVEIRPYQALQLSPSVAALHYGQAIFEGIKAYKSKEGKPFIFRPLDNFKRFNQSATRMHMPEVPEHIFMEGMRELIELDKDWIPNQADHSLYIRPFMFSTDEMIGVKPSDSYKFMILLSPTGPYYAAPMRIYVEEHFTRAAPGGIGFAKAAGNYGSVLLPTEEAKKKGYDQILWTDVYEHKYVQEIGTMNVFFVVGEKVMTPDLGSGTILAGVTRDSAITVFRDLGYQVVEKPISIEELIEDYKAGQLKEVFGTGTAATISMIRELRYKDFVMHFDTDSWKVAPSLKTRLEAIRAGEVVDNHHWIYWI